MPLEIRPAVATDLPHMMGLDHTCTTEYVWQLELHRESGQVSASLREVRLPRPVSVAYPRNPFALAEEWKFKSAVFVAVESSLVGYACLFQPGAAAVTWITDLVVAHDRRRRGIGSTLLEIAQEWAFGHGSPLFMMETQAKNQPAIRLAQKFGLDFCGYNDRYYANQDVALFFGRMLK